MRLPTEPLGHHSNHTTVRRETSIDRCSYAPIKTFIYKNRQWAKGVSGPHHGLRSLTATFKEQNCTPPPGREAWARPNSWVPKS